MGEGRGPRPPAGHTAGLGGRGDRVEAEAAAVQRGADGVAEYAHRPEQSGAELVLAGLEEGHILLEGDGGREKALRGAHERPPFGAREGRAGRPGRREGQAPGGPRSCPDGLGKVRARRQDGPAQGHLQGVVALVPGPVSGGPPAEVRHGAAREVDGGRRARLAAHLLHELESLGHGGAPGKRLQGEPREGAAVAGGAPLRRAQKAHVGDRRNAERGAAAQG
mmetsp:Transcript_74631/g.209432  ORF Transcript_74631/g.209432 Transcript_74631/m.209432 type:complete len:222 (+) Transcript_74631:777-1442(+)